MLHIVIKGKPDFSAIANVLAFNVSPNFSFFSCNTPAPVHEAPANAASSSSISNISQTANVAVYNSGQAPLDTHPG